ncbi:MAG: twin-arginine translocase TatA/TatE family subunit [Chloroflexi bacterium]|jgi:Sec-independent protein translocase protein TatA|nr:twin-arginine translocase TatA/TatE family subunit [Chloroflexota bacterium]MCH2522677.1 twin-arginine translocase TatA/TatE family subunit [Dehalococcoidia bacterium]|tara:strand:+ start:39 stop:254 length:216 start_codon:yes stop_codon:yes gene_type:complete
MNIIGIGFTELIFILLIALVFLGPGKMVEIAQKIGGMLRQFQNTANELPKMLALEDLEEPDKNEKSKNSQE